MADETQAPNTGAQTPEGDAAAPAEGQEGAEASTDAEQDASEEKAE